MRQPSGTTAPQAPDVDGLVVLTTWKVPQASEARRVAIYHSPPGKTQPSSRRLEKLV
jgi:hypothetical protein